METLRPRLQSRDGRADGAAHARSARGALGTISRSAAAAKTNPLPPVIASRSSDGPWREPGIVAVATVEAVVSDGQDSVPAGPRPPTYIPFVNTPQNERNIP